MQYGLILVLLIVVAGAYLVFTGKIDLSGLQLPFSVQDTSKGNTVTKQVQFTFTDKYSGTAAGTKTFYVYSGTSPPVLLESLTTDADGIKNTAKKYASGTHLYVKYVSGNSKIWYDVTVPAMGSDDAQASTYNTINLETFVIGTYATDTLRFGATSMNDNDKYNYTLSGTNPIFTYELANTGADNTGLMESFDPLYGCAWNVEVVVAISGTGYETVIPSGGDPPFTIGTTQYLTTHMSAEALTKWKVANQYQFGYQGTNSMSFSLDLSGYSSNGVTVQITAYAYADPAYAQAHGGQFGVDKVSLAEQTITLDAT
jgi:hypothetical protein